MMKKLAQLFSGRKKFVVAVIALVIVGFIGWKVYSGYQTTPQYQTAQVERNLIISSVSASGQVLSVNIMSANTKASGIVKTVYVKDGDQVKQGDKILEIDLDFQGQQKYAQAWASYLSAKNSLESAKVSLYTLQSDMLSKWDTFKELAESDTYETSDGSPRYDQRALPEFHIAQDDWLAAEAKYKNQQAVITQSQAALNSAWLDYTLTSPTITAPTAGTVTSLMYTPGMSIGSLDTGTTTSNQKVATIKTEGTPIISVNLSEIDVSQAQLGQKTTITFDSLEDKTFTGKVVGVDRIGQTSSGVTQYPAIIQLDTASEHILPNMTATAKIVVNQKDNALLVPTAAVQTQNGSSFVKVLKKGQVQSVSVETGLISDNQIEIVSGLEEGTEVVTNTITTNGSSQSNATSPFGGAGGATYMRMVR
jgi:RND family efflux transporter MFP subunit